MQRSRSCWRASRCGRSSPCPASSSASSSAEGRATPTPAIVHLIGYPASGKLTVAKALVAAAADAGRWFVRLDNHLTADPILAIADRSIHPIPVAVWDRVDDGREVVYRAIVEVDMLELSAYEPLQIDTTSQTPEQSAAVILAHLTERDADVTPSKKRSPTGTGVPLGSHARGCGRTGG